VRWKVGERASIPRRMTREGRQWRDCLLTLVRAYQEWDGTPTTEPSVEIDPGSTSAEIVRKRLQRFVDYHPDVLRGWKIRTANRARGNGQYLFVWLRRARGSGVKDQPEARGAGRS